MVNVSHKKLRVSTYPISTTTDYISHCFTTTPFLQHKHNKKNIVDYAKLKLATKLEQNVKYLLMATPQNPRSNNKSISHTLRLIFQHSLTPLSKHVLNFDLGRVLCICIITEIVKGY